MRHYLLPKDGTFYKTNLHCHTTVSDGVFSPEEIKALYKAAGYAAVAFTDHEVMIPHNDLSDGEFIALNGYEIALKTEGPDVRTGFFQKVCHLCLLAKAPATKAMVAFSPEYVTPGNCKNYIPFVTYVGGFFKREYSKRCIENVIADAHQNGYLVTFNHPRWSLQNEDEYRDIDGFDGVEVHNTGCVKQGDCDAAPYDALLRTGKRLSPIAADDTHKAEELFGGFTMLKAESLTYENLMHAYEKGDLYASEGPEIYDLYVEDGNVHIRTSPACRIYLRSGSRYAKEICAEEGKALTEAVFRLPLCQTYMRLEVLDGIGKKAFTRAYYLDEIS